QAWYHVSALMVGDRLRTLPSAKATFMAAWAVEANCALHWLLVPAAGLRGWTRNFEFSPDAQVIPFPMPPAKTAEKISPGKLSSLSFTPGAAFSPSKTPRIHHVPERPPGPSQRAYFSAKTIVFEVPSGKERGSLASPSQTVS